MLNKTALRSTAYLVRVKAAIIAAVRCAHAPHRSALGIGHDAVTDRKGRFSLRVVWRRGHGLEIFDRQDRDVTDVVLTALKAFHMTETRVSAA
ncbi:hypothetical protein [Pseudomonas aeruginosa]|uniref:hypothetical protein n=1 Tax=Pseudomonas aeruginosa TaxID=287 RepID=UPI001EDBCD76|nr:hypothetical protein [Pseudomonas aeruginosa]MCG3073130.1 hypothetical protein [Pseudomonas aeruginosa]